MPGASNGQNHRREANRLAQRKFRHQRKNYIAHLEQELALCRSGASNELTQRRLEVEKSKAQRKKLRKLLLQISAVLKDVCSDNEGADDGDNVRDEEPSPPKSPSSSNLIPADNLESFEMADLTSVSDPDTSVPTYDQNAFYITPASMSTVFTSGDQVAELHPTALHGIVPSRHDDCVGIGREGGSLNVQAFVVETGSQLDTNERGNSRDHTDAEFPADQILPLNFESSVGLTKSSTCAIPAGIQRNGLSSSCIMLTEMRPANKTGNARSSMLCTLMQRRITQFLDLHLSTGEPQHLELSELDTKLSCGLLEIINECMSIWARYQAHSPLSMYAGSGWAVWQIVRCNFVLPRLIRSGLVIDSETDDVSLESFRNDIPDWFKPTDLQQSLEHNPCIDYIPWPDVRDRLILHPDFISLDDFFVNVSERFLPTGIPEDGHFCGQGAAPNIRSQFETCRERDFGHAIYSYLEMWKVKRRMPNRGRVFIDSQVDAVLGSHLVE